MFTEDDSITDLIFAKKYTNEIVLCDFCQYHKCHWLDAKVGKVPERCHETVSFEIADHGVPKQEWEDRIEVAKKVGVYMPGEKRWYFSIRKGEKLTSRELRVVMDTINSWSESNKFKLCNYVKYIERRDIEDF